MSEDLKAQHEQYIAGLREAGDPITQYLTPCCNKIVDCRAGVSGEIWDTLVTCPHCGGLHIRVTAPDAVVGVIPGRSRAYYVVETRYAGTKRDTKHLNANKVEVWTVPAVTNSSKEVRLSGWCGTTNDWAIYAHGEFNSLEAATLKAQNLGPYRDLREGEGIDPMDDHVVYQIWSGEYRALDESDSWPYIGEEVKNSIKADTTDEQIAAFLDEMGAEANAAGYSLADMTQIVQAHRNDLAEDKIASDGPLSDLEQQLCGYVSAKRGESLSDLMSSAGATAEEWAVLRNLVARRMTPEEIQEIDQHFQEDA